MPTLVVVAYRDETSAATAGEQVQRLVRHLRIEPEGVAVVRRDREGRFHLTTNHQPAGGEVSLGMVWMLLFALLFAPPGRPAGAGLDALPRLVTAGGLDGHFEGEVRDRLGPGTSALFLLVEGGTDRLVEVLGPYRGVLLRTALSADQLAALRDALPAAAEALAFSGGRGRARGTG